MKTVLHCSPNVLHYSMVSTKKVSLDLAKKLDFDLDPKLYPEIPVKSDPDPEFPSKSDPDPEIIFSDPTHCLSAQNKKSGHIMQCTYVYLRMNR